MSIAAAKPTKSIPKVPRPSTNSKWRALALVMVHLAILAHILHWRSTGETLGPVEPSEAISFSQNSVITAGLVFFVVSTLATLLFGRWFCGWGCHLLALQDSCLWLLKKFGIRPKQMRSRALLLGPIAAFAYMFLYPAIFRLVNGQGIAEPSTEFVVEDFWATFPPWPVALATFAVAGFAIVYFLGAKGFCTNVCPYGAAFGAVDKLSPARIRVTDACEGCGHCTQVCTSNVVVHSEVRDYGMVVDQECMKCLDCVSVCPKGALYFGFGKPAILAKPFRSKRLKTVSSWWKLNRWSNYSAIEELFLGVMFVVAFFTFRGLYDTIPFLFALAIAAILTYGALQALRLIYKPKVQIQGFELKRDGAITAAGKYYCGIALLIGAFWLQSGYLHIHRAAAEKGYIELNDLVADWLGGPRELSTSEARLVDATLEHVRIAEAFTPLSLFPREEWELSLTSGWLHLLRGDEATFEAKLRRAIEVLPQNYVAFDGLANFHAAGGRPEEANHWFERATQAAPDDFLTWANWSNYLANTGRSNEAREVLLRAAEIDDAAIGSLMSLARYQLELGELPAAAETLESVLQLDPTGNEARLSLAGVMRELGQFGKSIEHYELALQTGADNFEIRLATTLSCNLAGQLDRAEEHARAASAHAPDRPEPWYALRQIALSRGDEEQAQLYLKEAESRAENVPN